MSANIEKQASVLDKFIWFAVVAALVAAVAGNYYLENTDIPAIKNFAVLARVLVVVVALSVALGLAMTTEKGRMIWEFAKESRIEVRKVVWPTRQESMQTTLIVLAVTLIMGILFFPLDALIVWVVNLVTGV